MTEREHYTAIRALYHEFYFLLYKERYWFSKINETQTYKFIAELDKKIHRLSRGHNWYYNYMVFQFNYWCSCEIDALDQKIKTTWVFGKKALQRYFERDLEKDWMLETCDFIQRFGVKKSKFIKNDDSIDLNVVRKIDDTYRAIYFNTFEGFTTCLSLTSLYNRKSKFCLKCISQEDCIKVLKRNSK